MRSIALFVLAATVVSCGPKNTQATRPSNVEAVGAPDHFGRGIVRVGDSGDRVLVDVTRPGYWALVRFDTSGAAIAAAAMETRRTPGITWLEIPAGQNASRATASVTNPQCAENNRNAQRACLSRPREFTTGPALLRTGEVLILFVSTDPLRPALLEDRLNAIPEGAPLMQVPARVMQGRTDIWAAYLIRRT